MHFNRGIPSQLKLNVGDISRLNNIQLPVPNVVDDFRDHLIEMSIGFLKANDLLDNGNYPSLVMRKTQFSTHL